MSELIGREVFGLVFADSADILFVVDRRSGRIVAANRTLATLLAMDLAALVDLDLHRLVGDPTRPVIGAGRYADVVLRHAGGSEVHVELDCVWVTRFAAFTARDLGERRRLERDVEVARRQVALLAMRASVGELVAGIAHHLNNPVGALDSTLRRLATEVGFLPARDRAVLDRLLQRAMRVASRIEANVNAIVQASNPIKPASRESQLELPHEVAIALASFVGRLDEIPTKESA